MQDDFRIKDAGRNLTADIQPREARTSVAAATTVADRVSDLGQAIKDAGTSKIDEVKTRVVGTGLAAGLVEDIEQGAPKFGHALRDGAQDVEKVSKRFDERTAGELIVSVRNFPRERPIAALLSALLTGIVVGRFFSN